MGRRSSYVGGVSVSLGIAMLFVRAALLGSCTRSSQREGASSAPPAPSSSAASITPVSRPVLWKRFKESSAIVNSATEAPVPLSVLEPKFVSELRSALRSTLPGAVVEGADGKISITHAGQSMDVSTKALAWQCPMGEGTACDAAIRELALSVARDVADPPSCAGKPLEPELFVEEETIAGVLSAHVAGRLYVGVAAYMENRSVRAWCTTSEAPGISLVYPWARAQVASRPPPPVEPMPGKEGIWMVVEKGEVAVYFLDAERLLAAIEAPKGPLVAVVPTVNMVLFTTGDRKDRIAELRLVAKTYANKPGTRGLSDEVYEWQGSKWVVLPVEQP